MSIAAVSAKPKASYVQMGDDGVIKALERQKMNLKEQIRQINESKMDLKLKQEKIKELNDQIVEIDMQIRQRQLEKLNPDRKESAKSSEDREKEKLQKETDQVDVMSEHMVSAAFGYSDLAVLGKLRTELKGEYRLATRSGENPGAGKGIARKINKLEGDMLEKTDKINESLKKAAEEEKKTGSKEENKEAQEDSKTKAIDIRI